MMSLIRSSCSVSSACTTTTTSPRSELGVTTTFSGSIPSWVAMSFCIRTESAAAASGESSAEASIGTAVSTRSSSPSVDPPTAAPPPWLMIVCSCSTSSTGEAAAGSGATSSVNVATVDPPRTATQQMRERATPSAAAVLAANSDSNSSRPPLLASMSSNDMPSTISTLCETRSAGTATSIGCDSSAAGSWPLAPARSLELKISGEPGLGVPRPEPRPEPPPSSPPVATIMAAGSSTTAITHAKAPATFRHFLLDERDSYVRAWSPSRSW